MIKIKTPTGDIEVGGLRYSGLFDKNNREICENDTVQFNYSGKPVQCTVIFTKGLFCLKWPDGYINHYPLNPANYEIV